MLGINDPWILLVYLLCILSAVACVVYGLVNWNKGAENEPAEMKEEIKWEKEETQIEENL
jgi:hypothetical protein